MKGWKKKSVACLVLLMATVVMSTESRQPVLHKVGGGKFTWKPDVNFTDWASHEHFYVGDWLYFGFDKHLYSVLQVNKTSYEHCIEENFIKNITRGGRDVVNLTEAKPFYFISGRGYCFKGMKVAIFVHDFPPLAVSSNDSHPPTSTNAPFLITSSSSSHSNSPPTLSSAFIVIMAAASYLAWIV